MLRRFSVLDFEVEGHALLDLRRGVAARKSAARRKSEGKVLRRSLKCDPALLQDAPIFAGLGEEALREVLGCGQLRRWRKGEVIFAQGAETVACHILLAGQVKIQQTSLEARQVIVRFIAPKEMFGTLAMFLKSGYPGDAVAVSDSTEIVWSSETMRRLMLDHPQIALNTLSMLGSRLEDFQARVRELSTQRVERRLAHALLRLVRQAGSPVESGLAIDFPLRRQDLGEMTGTTLSTVSRTLSAWESQGIVQDGHRQQIIIKDARALQSIAEDGLEAEKSG